MPYICRLIAVSFHFHFFFQAEDGIRDGHVTGVQTCALPIYRPVGLSERAGSAAICRCLAAWRLGRGHEAEPPTGVGREKNRSEERRVGKEWRAGVGAEHE